MSARDRVVALFASHTLLFTAGLVLLIWVVEALLHGTGGAAGFEEHLFSSRAHNVVSRLLTATLIFSLAFLLRAEYLRRHSQSELGERTKLAELGAAIGLILAEETTLEGMLGRCAETIVAHLDAHLARFWLHEPREGALVLRASAGRYAHLDGPHARIPVGATKVGAVARDRTAHQTNEVSRDPAFDDQEWVRREGIAAFAGHPLMIGDTLLGVMGIFSRRAFTPGTSEWLAVLAREVALGVGRRLSEDGIRRAGEEWSKTFDAMPDLVFTVDEDFRLVKANRALEERLGVGAQEIAGRRCYEVIHGTDAPPPFCPHVIARRDGAVHSLEIADSRLGGEFLLSVAPLSGDGGRPAGVVHVARDIGERKLLQKRLEEAAYTDELTGLFNRRGFFVLAGKQVELARRRRDAFGLLYVDVDLMKEINDRWGHREGDRALRDTADLLRRAFRKADTIGRVGGDEFVVFLSELADAGSQEAVLANLRRALAEHNERHDRPYRLDLSGGIACSEAADPCSLEDLFTQADRNMYLQKEATRAGRRDMGRRERPRLDPRASPRVSLAGVSAELVPGGSAALVDVSAGGGCVSTTEPLVVGTTCDLHIGGGDRPLKVAVVWSAPRGPGATDEAPSRSGLRFAEPL